MPISLHSHSGQFCAHASNSLEEMVQSAIAKKIRVYALTEHMPRGPKDLYPEEASTYPSISVLLLLQFAYEEGMGKTVNKITKWQIMAPSCLSFVRRVVLPCRVSQHLKCRRPHDAEKESYGSEWANV